MAVDDAVWVQHGDELEHILLPQHRRPRVILPQEELDESVHDVRGTRLPRVDSGTHEHDLLALEEVGAVVLLLFE